MGPESHTLHVAVHSPPRGSAQPGSAAGCSLAGGGWADLHPQPHLLTLGRAAPRRAASPAPNASGKGWGQGEQMVSPHDPETQEPTGREQAGLCVKGLALKVLICKEHLQLIEKTNNPVSEIDKGSA